MVFYFLSLAICFILWGWPCISLLTGKIFPYTHCPWTIDIHICGRIFFVHPHIGSCVDLPYLLPSVFVLLPLPSLPLSWILIFKLVVFSVLNKIWRVMIPCACILYSNTNIKDNAWILGEHSLLFRTLSYLSNIWSFKLAFDFYLMCLWKTNLFFWCFVPS